MKTYDERYDDVVRKMERLEKKRRTKRKVIGASCMLLAVAVLAMVLFVPYSTAAPDVSQYSGSPCHRYSTKPPFSVLPNEQSSPPSGDIPARSTPFSIIKFST